MNDKKYFVVKYTGTFGFIKPCSAVRDEFIFSLSHLTPSILNGIEQKLFPETLNQKENTIIVNHKLNHTSTSIQQETVSAKRIKDVDSFGVLKRRVLLYPVLYLAFYNEEYAKKAFSEHVCLTRNEDILLPINMFECSHEEFEEIKGITFVKDDNGFFVGRDRFNTLSDGSFSEMKIKLKIK